MAIDSKQHAIHFKFCVERNIRIYPVPVKKGELKIVVETDGIQKIGEIVFHDPPEKGGKSIWEKIPELYKIIYDREILKENGK